MTGPQPSNTITISATPQEPGYMLAPDLACIFLTGELGRGWSDNKVTQQKVVALGVASSRFEDLDQLLEMWHLGLSFLGRASVPSMKLEGAQSRWRQGSNRLPCISSWKEGAKSVSFVSLLLLKMGTWLSLLSTS